MVVLSTWAHLGWWGVNCQTLPWLIFASKTSLSWNQQHFTVPAKLAQFGHRLEFLVSLNSALPQVNLTQASSLLHRSRAATDACCCAPSALLCTHHLCCVVLCAHHPCCAQQLLCSITPVVCASLVLCTTTVVCVSLVLCTTSVVHSKYCARIICVVLSCARIAPVVHNKCCRCITVVTHVVCASPVLCATSAEDALSVVF